MENFFSRRTILIYKSGVLKHEVTLRQSVPRGNLIIGSAVFNPFAY
jgi:hypothetical protein